MPQRKKNRSLLEDTALNLAFGVLNETKTSVALRRQAAQVLYEKSPEFLADCEAQDWPLEFYVHFARGARAAMNAAPLNSRLEGMCCVIWDHMIGNLSRKDPAFAVAEIRSALADPTLKKFSVGANKVVSYLRIMPVLSGLDGWGKSSSDAVQAFNSAVAAATPLVRPGSSYARQLVTGEAYVKAHCVPKPA